ncbi:gamma-glutamyl-gamma-aminobutyrate hydrolase family protein [Candidatus Berkiella aquae]|uniref:Gamma-glutamyl-gamma-aminobutyrate hydrolase family protein n=1 Tax=Candidatus Berkiella aquae TaxID=295108 RepID=A0A0Q9YV66_9GAMM|nr:gamma-glutamyl-gamma-aminobutyrate hydrolase family protein [Candidatus Berkiella aquae]MCS5710938.1 gamma-glutamyl-gamma-aminobutyrate hydrolase family protein [Candidatus Berkiella aquae]
MVPGPKQMITQEAFEALIAQVPKDQPMASLSKLLEDNGYSPILSNIDFAIVGLTIDHPSGAGKVVSHGRELLKNVDYSGITFNDCKLEECNFSGSHFENCRFNNTSFKNAIFENCNIKQTSFENCRFESTLMMRANIEENVLFSNCNMKNVDFYKAKFGQEVKFRGTSVTDSVFIAAEDQGVIWEATILKDCVLPKDKEFFKNATKEESQPPKPVVGILWQPHKPGHSAFKVYEQLRKQGAVPVRISYLSDNEVDLKNLDSEVKQSLNKYEKKRSEGKAPDKSRAMAILEAADKNPQAHQETQKIIDRSRLYSEYLDSMLIPGGADIPSELYGQPPDPRAEPESDYMRSVIEFALIRDQQARGNPMMGICRGCQILNVYHGGDMIQRLDDKGNFKSAPPIKALPGTHGIMPSLLQETVKGMSVHHQAIQNIGDNVSQGAQLEVVATYNGVVKAAQEKYGAPIMMTQFHPEFHGDSVGEAYDSHKGSLGDKIQTGASVILLNSMLNNNNDDFIATFIDATKHRKEKTGVVEEIKQVKATQDAQVNLPKVESGVVEEPTLRPSRLKGKERSEQPHVTQTSKSSMVKSFIQNYRYHQDAKNQKRANRFPLFKKLAFRVISYLDRKIFSRKQERVIRNLKRDQAKLKKLQKEPEKNEAKIQTIFNKSVNKISAYYAKNKNTTLAQVSADFLAKETGFDPQVNQRKNYESYNSALEIRKFVDEYPTSNLAKAITTFARTEHFANVTKDASGKVTVTQEKRFPTNEKEMLMVVDWYNRKHSQMANNTLLTPKDKLLGVQLNELSAKGSLLTIDEIHLKYSLSIAELMQGGEAYQKYNEALHTFLNNNEGKYPASRQEWRKFQGMIAEHQLSDTQTIEFIKKTGAIFQRIEDLEQKLKNETDPAKVTPLKKEILDTKNEVVASMMVGPQEMSHAISKYIEQHRGLPVDSNSWKKFKEGLGSVSDPEAKELISKVDKLQAEWKNEAQAKIEQFINKNPDDKMSKVLIEYKKEVGTLPLTQEAWGQFLSQYEELSEKILFDPKATELMYHINQRELLVKDELKLMSEPETKRAQAMTFNQMPEIEKEEKPKPQPSITTPSMNVKNR